MLKHITRKRLVAVFVAGALTLGTMAGCPSQQNSQPGTVTEEGDCDFGDRLEGDSDCEGEGGSGHTKTKKKPKTSKPKAAEPASGTDRKTEPLWSDGRGSGSKKTPSLRGFGDKPRKTSGRH